MTLDELAIKFDSDKSSLHHNYCPIYEHYFHPLQNDSIKLLELGIGGYHHPDKGGASLKMWYEYFPKARIIGIDIHLKEGLNNDRTQVFKCSQIDEEGLSFIIEPAGRPNIIIDDASHINPLTIRSFEILWNFLNPGGLYVVEDTESSWCAEDGWAKGCEDYKNYDYPTIINFFRQLCDEINTQYIPHFRPSKWYCDIDSIHFHKNLIVIKKKV